jgi:hypothetical protein
MSKTRLTRGTIVAAATLAAMAATGGGLAHTEPDPLSADVARWSSFLAGNTATDDIWKDVKTGSAPALDRVSQAMGSGRRLLAVLRLANVRENLYAASYLGARTAEQRRDTAAFEAEWWRMGTVLAADLALRPGAGLDTVRPVALRAMAEAAQSKLPVYYRASLEYGRSTTPDSGLFYLGAAEAQRDFVALVRRLSLPSGPPPPALPGLQAGLEALQADVLAAYQPPASVEKHPEFITTSALIKEARELAAAGAPYGALMKYLQAAVRFAAVRGLAASDVPAVSAELARFEPRLRSGTVDHSIGRLWLEYAEADLAEHATDGAAVFGPAIVRDVLPRYFAALEEPPARPLKPAPTVTVTLVRWPYT